MTTTTAGVHGCPVDESFDPLSAEFLADTYAALAAGRPAARRSYSPRRSATTS